MLFYNFTVFKIIYLKINTFEKTLPDQIFIFRKCLEAHNNSMNFLN